MSSLSPSYNCGLNPLSRTKTWSWPKTSCEQHPRQAHLKRPPHTRRSHVLLIRIVAQDKAIIGDAESRDLMNQQSDEQFYLLLELGYRRQHVRECGRAIANCVHIEAACTYPDQKDECLRGHQAPFSLKLRKSCSTGCLRAGMYQLQSNRRSLGFERFFFNQSLVTTLLESMVHNVNARVLTHMHVKWWIMFIRILILISATAAYW